MSNKEFMKVYHMPFKAQEIKDDNFTNFRLQIDQAFEEMTKSFSKQQDEIILNYLYEKYKDTKVSDVWVLSKPDFEKFLLEMLPKWKEPKQYVDELKLVEKKLKALEIIKEKECDVRWLKFCIKGNAEVETYNSGHGYRKKLTEEEFDTLKEMLMKYRVSRCADSPKKRKLKGCSTWGYKIVDTKEEAKNLAKEWKQLGYYTEIKEVLE